MFFAEFRIVGGDEMMQHKAADARGAGDAACIGGKRVARHQMGFQALAVAGALDKPVKFAVAIVLYMLTLAYIAALITYTVATHA